ncbi:hypothetical protein EJ05DRAFT_505844 [Pseudovirgaria hyperparasitica]|uniref:Uncharacterized protein n=1 Tax=Pseudovirgaria hyperparasitica TaxID=470096 RepID=A0A6A6VSV4_9PEZI|nr:uncharacterized protein EJ05DRAFT_505844 [Pseudovirgaria hyperparasitica]KAF2752670.1 hypothetical protein EJ05DRAFT_505844 [Pseudovirgaria hyperparasitica]
MRPSRAEVEQGAPCLFEAYQRYGHPYNRKEGSTGMMQSLSAETTLLSISETSNQQYNGCNIGVRSMEDACAEESQLGHSSQPQGPVAPPNSPISITNRLLSSQDVVSRAYLEGRTRIWLPPKVRDTKIWFILPGYMSGRRIPDEPYQLLFDLLLTILSPGV